MVHLMMTRVSDLVVKCGHVNSKSQQQWPRRVNSGSEKLLQPTQPGGLDWQCLFAAKHGELPLRP